MVQTVLLVTLAYLATNSDLAIVDPNIEPTIWAGAHPSLVTERGPFPAVVRERQKNPVLAL